jgi:hypothetical protein
MIGITSCAANFRRTRRGSRFAGLRWLTFRRDAIEALLPRGLRQSSGRVRRLFRQSATQIISNHKFCDSQIDGS